MKNYRIKKVSEPSCIFYYPQRKILGFFWVDMHTDGLCTEVFTSYEDANEALCNAIAKPKVEYLDVKCESIQND